MMDIARRYYQLPKRGEGTYDRRDKLKGGVDGIEAKRIGDIEGSTAATGLRRFSHPPRETSDTRREQRRDLFYWEGVTL